MAEEAEISTRLQHEYFGNPDCCGLLSGIIRGDQAEIFCTECNALTRSIRTTELRQTLTDMQLSLDVSTAIYPNCGAVNVAPGFSNLLAFTCERCGAVTKLADDPMADRFFG
jgi:hypothetical protein